MRKRERAESVDKNKINLEEAALCDVPLIKTQFLFCTYCAIQKEEFHLPICQLSMSIIITIFIYHFNEIVVKTYNQITIYNRSECVNKQK